MKKSFKDVTQNQVKPPSLVGGAFSILWKTLFQKWLKSSRKHEKSIDF